MKNKLVLLIFLKFAFLPKAFTQDLGYARTVIDIMASPEMHGRGYVNNGDRLAAAFIAGEFKKFNIQKAREGKNGYYQKFKFPVNTFPKDMKVSVDEKALLPGVDFLADAHSSKAKGRFELYHITSAKLHGSPDKIKNKILVIDKSAAISEIDKMAMDLWMNDPHGAAGIIMIEENKLTWTATRKQYKYPVLHILKGALPADAKYITVDIDAKFRKKHKANNVIGMIKGSSVPDSFLVFTAHYDHLGRMGSDTYFPGANDNASGVSMMLNLAKHYSVNPPRYSVLFIAFAGEEAGLLGSEYYVKHPYFPLKNIKFLLNMDLLGTGDDGLMVVNGDVYKEQFALMDTINNQKQYVKSLQKRGKARNSDHYWFGEKDVPCFFIYTLGGVSFYHDINDRSKTLPLTDYSDVFRLITDFTGALQ